MTEPRIPFSPGVVILGGGAVLLSVALFVGFLLPTDWEAEASAYLAVEPHRAFEYFDSPEGWQRWTPWPDSGLVREGPERGEGASIRWDDRELGEGSFRIVEVVPSERVRYEVEVEGGAMLTGGLITIAAEGAGARITWREEGDLGWNPLMGYWALFMDRAQTTELEKGLAQLTDLVAGT